MEVSVVGKFFGLSFSFVFEKLRGLDFFFICKRVLGEEIWGVILFLIFYEFFYFVFNWKRW